MYNPKLLGKPWITQTKSILQLLVATELISGFLSEINELVQNLSY